MAGHRSRSRLKGVHMRCACQGRSGIPAGRVPFVAGRLPRGIGRAATIESPLLTDRPTKSYGVSTLLMKAEGLRMTAASDFGAP